MAKPGRRQRRNDSAAYRGRQVNVVAIFRPPFGSAALPVAPAFGCGSDAEKGVRVGQMNYNL